jgi:hypothetical protein
MYMRRTRRTNKDGSTVSYLQLAHNERDPETGCPAAKVLWNFGREDSVDKDALRRLMQSIARVLSPDEHAAAGMGFDIGSIAIRSGKSLGGAWALDQLWEKLGIRTALRNLLADRQFAAPVERAVFAMTANRALAPSSKLAIEDWVKNDVVVEGLPEVQVHQLYRAMDFLIENNERIQETVFFSTANLLNLEVDLIYFDTASICFEVEPDARDEEELRRPGCSKDHRPDLLQAVIGLAATRDGIPVRCWVWPGNTNDMEAVAQVKKDMTGWRLGRVITVVDRGLSSADNLRHLQRAGGHYIAGERMRAGMKTVEEALSRQGRYRPVRENLEVKEIMVGDGEARIRYVLARNPVEAERDRRNREETLAVLREKLKELKPACGEQHSKAVCELMASRKFGKCLTLGSDGVPRIDQAKVKQEARLDGKYLIRTSDDTLSPEDAALGYKQLLEVEDAFRTLKSTLDMRPMYHRLSDRIRSHVLLCWLALLLVRIAETKVGDTWPKIRTQLERIRIVEMDTPDGRVVQRTEINPAQKTILSRLGLGQPKKIHEISLKTKANA